MSRRSTFISFKEGSLDNTSRMAGERAFWGTQTVVRFCCRDINSTRLDSNNAEERYKFVFSMSFFSLGARYAISWRRLSINSDSRGRSVIISRRDSFMNNMARSLARGVLTEFWNPFELRLSLTKFGVRTRVGRFRSSSTATEGWSVEASLSQIVRCLTRRA